jgi:hypothetical protein
MRPTLPTGQRCSLESQLKASTNVLSYVGFYYLGPAFEQLLREDIVNRSFAGSIPL